MAPLRFSQKNEQINLFCFSFLLFTAKKHEFVRSFIGRIYCAPICLWFYLTFSMLALLLEILIGQSAATWPIEISTSKANTLAHQRLNQMFPTLVLPFVPHPSSTATPNFHQAPPPHYFCATNSQWDMFNFLTLISEWMSIGKEYLFMG